MIATHSAPPSRHLPEYGNKLIDQAVITEKENTYEDMLKTFKRNKSRSQAYHDTMSKLRKLQMKARRDGFVTRDIIGKLTCQEA